MITSHIRVVLKSEVIRFSFVVCIFVKSIYTIAILLPFKVIRVCAFKSKHFISEQGLTS